MEAQDAEGRLLILTLKDPFLIQYISSESIYINKL